MSPEYIFAGVVGVFLVGAVVFNTATASDPIAEPTEINDEGVCCTSVDGVLVPADPEGLARGRGVSPDVYALARVIESEASGLPWIGQVGVAWVVRNVAAKKGRTILRTVTRATLEHGKTDGTGDGFFGRQGDSIGGYRFVASSKDPPDDVIETATAVASGDVDDPTGGALNFDSPQSYGKQAGTSADGADAFATSREGEGKELVTLPGVSESRLRFWRPA